MIINVHAGHNPDGKKACGAIGFLQESTEARKVKNEVIGQLRLMGHTVYDCTCENGTSQADVLTKIVKACNAHTVDLDVSIHFNAGGKDRVGDGRTAGVEVLIYQAGNAAQGFAERVADAVSDLGYQKRSDGTSPVNGVKIRPDLYVLKNTKAPSMLIECCFVDDKDDVQLYDYRKMAEAIVYGMTGERIIRAAGDISDEEDAVCGAETATGDFRQMYRVQVGAYSVKENAQNVRKKLKEAGFDAIIVAS